MSAVLEYLPRGNTLSDEAWHRRHLLLLAILAGHLPALFAFGIYQGFDPGEIAEVLAVPLACLLLGRVLRSRRPASIFVTLGLVYCSAALVGLSGGTIEAHFHFFIMIGFIALYQDWVPFLLNVLFTVLSHGIGSSLLPGLMFNHTAAQNQPWTWSLIHGVAVLAACVGVVLFWRTTEEEQTRSLRLREELNSAELGRRRFTSDLLVNLARRNQNLLYRQLELINRLEDKERDADALSDLFALDHLATRIRRNAESLLVLSGEESPRTWRGSVLLIDAVRAAIAETEDLDRIDFAIDDSLALSGRAVADLTHLLAELLENAVHFSPPGVAVMLRSRPSQRAVGTQVLTIEDWGVGMTQAELADANDLLRRPREVDLAVSRRLGLHVVSRLARRHGISIELTATPGGGVTAVVVLPAELFADPAKAFGGELVGAGLSAAAGAGMGPGAVNGNSGPGEPGRPAAVAVRPADAADPDRGSLPPDRATPVLPRPGTLPATTTGSAVRVGVADGYGPSQDRSTEYTDGAPLPPRPGRLSASIETSRPFEDAPAPGASLRRTGEGWSSWWTPQPREVHPTRSDPSTAARPHGGGGGAAAAPAPSNGPPPAAHTEAAPTAAAHTDPAETVASPPRLNRRVPQTHLAAGLRRKPSDGEQSAAVNDPVATRVALSRFQASQRAGREAVGGSGGQDPFDTSRDRWS